MAKPTIDAKQALEDIRSGLNEQKMMVKYCLSAKGLLSLLRKLIQCGAISSAEILSLMPDLAKSMLTVSEAVSPVLSRQGSRTINAKEVLKDLVIGMADSDLMEKYFISATGLNDLFQQIMAAGLLTKADLEARKQNHENTVDIKNLGNIVFEPPGTDEKHEPSPLNSDSLSGYISGVKTHADWTCPACKRVLIQMYDECPVCGVVVAKFLAKTADSDVQQSV